MEHFKPCELIELHTPEGPLVIQRESYNDYKIGWLDHIPTETISIAGREIERLCQYFNVQHEESISAQVIGKNRERRTIDEFLKNTCFPILYRESYSVGFEKDGRSIQELHAKILGPHLIEILVKWRWTDNTEVIPPNDSVLVTYSGSFTVWWSDKKDTTDGDK